MRKKKLIVYGVLILALVIIRIVLAVIEHCSDSASQTDHAFHQITETILCEELAGNSLNIHYSFSNPEKYGIVQNQICLTPFTQDSFENAAVSIQNYLLKLSLIDSSLLSETDYRTYIQLENFLKKEAAYLQFPYYSEPLSPHSGIQNELPILLAEYTLQNREDIQEYLSLLKCIPVYLSGYALYEKNKSEAGLFMSDESAEIVISQCEQLFTAQQLWKHTHFLQIAFDEKMEQLISQQEITPEEGASYCNYHDEYLLDFVMPAFTSLGDSLYLLLNTGNNQEGLCHYPKGKDYYELLLYDATGSSKTPDEILELLTEQLQKEQQKFHEILLQLTQEDAISLIASDPVMSLTDANTMIDSLRNKIASDFPPLDSGITYQVKEVSEALSEYSAPAFYLTPPIDDLNHNTIYLNQSDKTDPLTLYTTLAHEGFPGHLYQTVYRGSLAQEKKEDPIYCLFYYGGYTEGWATYVENISYDYVKEYLEEPLLASLYQSNHNLQLCIFSLLDLSIHYYGMNYDESVELLSLFGLSDPEEMASIYRYIVEEPCNYLKYYLGYLEVLECEELAKEQWGELYSPVKFRTFFLDFGPSDFSSIKLAMKRQNNAFSN